MTTALVFPGQGSQTVGMGKALADAFPAAREVFARVDAALGEKLSHVIFEGPGGGADADRERPAGPDGDQPGGAARARERSRARRRARRRPSSPAIRWANIPRLRGRRADARGCRAAAAHSRRRRCRRRFRSAKARWRRSSASISRGVERSPPQAASDLYLTGAICEAANDNGGGQVVISGTKAAVERAMELAKLQGRQARAAAAGVRALPLRADAAGGRRDGRGAGEGDDLARPGAAGRQCQREPVRSRGDPRQPGRAGDRHGALARKRRLMSAQGVTRFVEIGAGKVLAGSSSASPTARRALERRRRPADVAAFKRAERELKRLEDGKGDRDVRSDGKDRAGHRRFGRHRRRDRARAARARARPSRFRARGARRSTRWPANSASARPCSALRSRAIRPPSRRSCPPPRRRWAARHSRQQCRRDARQSFHAHEGRGMGRT